MKLIEMTENKIKEAANNPLLELLSKREVFIAGALSPEAKEYWQQGLYAEEEVRQLFISRAKEFSPPSKVFGDFLLKQDLDWLEKNKKK